jgi:hypothetical protein
MAYRVVSGFQDTETGVFYDIHEEIDEKNKNLKKYLDAGVVVDDAPKKKEVKKTEKGD